MATQIFTQRSSETSEGIKINEIMPIVTENDYWMATNGTFTMISEFEYKNIDADEFTSQCYSSYKVKDDFLYRHSNHWDKVATCRWSLKKEGQYKIISGRNVYLFTCLEYAEAFKLKHQNLKNQPIIDCGKVEINYLPSNFCCYGKIKISDLKRNGNLKVL